MASFRKRYSDLTQSPADRSAPAVASTPQVAAEPPPPTEAPKPTEDLTTEKLSPAEQAAQNALKQRIAEMDRAESLQSEAVHQQQRFAAEVQQGRHGVATELQQPQQQQPTVEEVVATLPERAKRWYKAQPELFTNPEGAARIQYAHWVAKRETGEELTEKYFDRMDHLLGFRQQQPAQPKPAPTQENKVNGHAPASAPAAPRDAAPVRQQRPGPSVSAPPTRTAPSMTTGRPVNHRPPLTADEVALAAHLKISPEEYALQKDKMQRLKAAGAIQN
jgi:hypothetical protein